MLYENIIRIHMLQFISVEVGTKCDIKVIPACAIYEKQIVIIAAFLAGDYYVISCVQTGVNLVRVRSG